LSTYYIYEIKMKLVYIFCLNIYTFLINYGIIPIKDIHTTFLGLSNHLLRKRIQIVIKILLEGSYKKILFTKSVFTKFIIK